MDAEPWEDAGLCAQLEQLVRRGEGQDLEFKAEIPPQASKLAEEVAAFATSSGGLLLLGVDDAGSIVGLEGVGDVQGRDQLTSRVSGVLRGVIPPVRTSLLWASSRGRTVLAIKVRKGVKPLYYAGSRPMIRDHASSRPATPDEVIEAVEAYIKAGRPELDAEQRAESEFIASTAPTIADLIGWCDLPGQMLDLKPWVDHWEFAAQAAASHFRDVAAGSYAQEHDHAAHLLELAAALDAVHGFLHAFGSGRSFRATTAAARQLLVSSLDRVADGKPLDQGSITHFAEVAEKECRKLSASWDRATAEPSRGQVEETIEESFKAGRSLLRCSYFKFPGSLETGALVRDACLQLIALSERRMYKDGGASQAAAIEAGRRSVEALRSAARALREALTP